MGRLGTPGIYFVYRVHPDEGGRHQRMLAGRFVIMGIELKILEDHIGFLGQMLPEGELTATHLRRLAQLAHSPYWQIVSETDEMEGHDEIPELDLGEPDGTQE